MKSAILALALSAPASALVPTKTFSTQQRSAPRARRRRWPREVRGRARPDGELHGAARQGPLACDESTGTVGKRLESIGLENTEANRQTGATSSSRRRSDRRPIFSTFALRRRRRRDAALWPPESGHVERRTGHRQYISGAILYEETLFQDDPSGKPFVDVLKAANIIPGIKVDMGLRPLVTRARRGRCTGLDGLLERGEKYYAQGARFAKWRTALKVDVANIRSTSARSRRRGSRTSRGTRASARRRAFVPIVEPEIMIDGVHDIQTSVAVQERVPTTVYKKIQENGVMLEGSLLKPAMVVPGVDAADKSDPTEIAQLTVRTLERCVPGAMPGVTFLSGGISEEDASIYLNEINKVPRKTQTRLTFSYSRALQSVTQCGSFNGPPTPIDATRLRQTRSWVVSVSILSRFGPRRGRRGVSERPRSRRWRLRDRTAATGADARPRRRDAVSMIVRE